MRAAWWWIDRWRKSTARTDMGLAERGAYRELLDECWLRPGGVIPDDDAILARIVNCSREEWAAVKAAVLARFEKCEGGYRNETADEVIATSRQLHERQQEKGRARAAKAVRGPDGTFSSSRTSRKSSRASSRKSSRGVQPESSLPSPSPSPSPSMSPEPENDQSQIADAIRQVFDYWKLRTKRTEGTVYSPDRKAVLLRRYLEEPGETPEQKVAGLKLAVDGALADPFFSGDNEKGKVYWDFKAIFRNRDRVEKLQEAARRTAAPPPPVEDKVPEYEEGAEEIWSGVKTILSGTIPSQNFVTWFRPTEGRGWEMDDISGQRVLVVTVPSQEHKKQIREVYGERVKKLLTIRNVGLLRLAVRELT